MSGAHRLPWRLWRKTSGYRSPPPAPIERRTPPPLIALDLALDELGPALERELTPECLVVYGVPVAAAVVLVPAAVNAIVAARAAAPRAAIMVVASQLSSRDEVVGFLHAGADDYVSSGVATAELAARIRVLLRGSVRVRPVRVEE